MPAISTLPQWRPVPQLAGIDLGNHSDRSRPPEDTIAAVMPHLGQLGISRLARQTDLDRLGIPCWSAFRPNSRFLSTSQGKGLTDAAACASALMEAAEAAIAEEPAGDVEYASAAELDAQQRSWFNPTRLMKQPFSKTKRIHWLAARDLHSSEQVWLPRDAVDVNGEAHEVAGICKTSNGLASGNTTIEATFHALCELIERDGTTLASLLPIDQAINRCFAPADLADPAIDRLVELIVRSGFTVTLFDQTSDLGVPVVMAIIAPRDAEGVGHAEIAGGWGCHPVAARAAIRAITEAAQCRVTAIAAARDDIRHKSYAMAAHEEVLAQVRATPAAPAPIGLPPGTTLEALLQHLIRATARRACRIFAVDISGKGLPFSVVKLVSPSLEDRDANLNWRPGKRARQFLRAA